MALADFSRLTSSLESSRSSERISVVCSPSLGGGLRTDAGVPDSL